MTEAVMLQPPDRSVSRLAFAVRLVDDFAPEREPPAGVTVTLTGGGTQGVRNPGGWHLFMDLPARTYRVSARSELYLAEDKEIDTALLDPGLPVVELLLKPSAAYPFPPGTTLVRCVVRNEADLGVPDARVEAVPWMPAPSVKGRVRQGGAQAGQPTIRLEHLSGELAAGDMLLVREGDPSRQEIVRIAAPLPSNASQPFNLAAPLRFGHAAGTPVHLLAAAAPSTTSTAGTGEFVVYQRNASARLFVIRLSTSAAGYRPDERDLEIVEGTTQSVGVISLQQL